MMIYNREVPPSVVYTWIQLRGLAWDREETPAISMPQLSDLTGKSQSTLYGHMALLRSWGALRMRPSVKGTFIVSFPADSGEFYLDGNSLPPDSENPEKPDLSLNKPINQLEINSVNEKERENNQLDHSRGEDFQISGVNSRNQENAAPRSGAKSPSGGPDLSLNPPIDILDINVLEERERDDQEFDQEINQVDLSRGEDFQNSGKDSRNQETFQDSGKVEIPPDMESADPIKIYRALTGIRPNRPQREHLIDQINDSSIWYASVEHWQSHGWNPKNITGILQLYHRGGPVACRYCPDQESSRDDPLSVLDEMRAEIKEQSNG